MLLLLLLQPAAAAAARATNELAIVTEPAATVCMPFASDGDEMKHHPQINDTLSTYRWIMAGGRGIDSAWSYDHGGCE